MNYSSAASASRPQTWLWTLVAFSLTSQTALNMARPQMSYKLIELGASEALIGALTALYALVPVFLAIWFGRYTERVKNLRHTVMAGGLLIGVGAALMALVPSIFGVACASVLLGFGHLIFVISSQASVTRYSTDATLDKGFGWQTAGIAAGQLLGPLLGGLLLGDSAGGDRMHLINLALWLGAVFAIVSVPLMLWPVRLKEMPALTSEIPITAQVEEVPQESTAEVLGEKPLAGASDGNPGKATTLKIMRRHGVVSNMFASLGMLSVTDILISFMPLVGEAAGVSPAWIGILLAIRSAATIVSRFSLSSLSRRWNRSQLVITSLLVSAVLIALIPPTINNVTISVIVMLIGGFFVGIAQPLTMTMIVKEVPVSWRSPALAVRLLGNRLGQVTIPLIAGAVASPLGPAGAIWFTCVLIGVSGIEKTINYARTGPTAMDR